MKYRDDQERARVAAQRKRVDRARCNATVSGKHVLTCPASRHLHIMAEALLRGGYPMLAEEPVHCAESIFAVLENLWKLRAESPQYEREIDAEIAKINAPKTHRE